MTTIVGTGLICGLLGFLLGSYFGIELEKIGTRFYSRQCDAYEEEVRKLKNRLDIITNVANYEPEE